MSELLAMSEVRITSAAYGLDDILSMSDNINASMELKTALMVSVERFSSHDFINYGNRDMDLASAFVLRFLFRISNIKRGFY